MWQPSWHIPLVWSCWCVCYSEMSTTWFSSSRGAWGWKSNIWTLLSCLYECKHEAWYCRPSVTWQFIKTLENSAFRSCNDGCIVFCLELLRYTALFCTFILRDLRIQFIWSVRLCISLVFFSSPIIYVVHEMKTFGFVIHVLSLKPYSIDFIHDICCSSYILGKRNF